MTAKPTLIRTLTQLAIVAAFGAAGPAFATDGGSSGSGSSSASDGAAGSASASAAAGDAAAGDASAAGDGSAGSAGPSTPTRVACFDRSVVAWRNTPECGQYANEPIPSDWATDPRFNEGPSQAVDAGSPPRRY